MWEKSPKDKNIGNHGYIGDISVLGFYGYIGDISADILTQNIDRPEIHQNLWKCKKKLLKNEIINIIDILKLFCWRNINMYDMICNIKFNYIVLAYKKCEFCKCRLIIKLNYYKYTNYVI